METVIDTRLELVLPYFRQEAMKHISSADKGCEEASREYYTLVAMDADKMVKGKATVQELMALRKSGLKSYEGQYGEMEKHQSPGGFKCACSWVQQYYQDSQKNKKNILQRFFTKSM